MDFWRSLSGMLEIELTSADPERTLEVLSSTGIELYNLQCVSELTRRMEIKRKDFKIIKTLCKKCGDTVSLRRRKGSFWSVKRVFQRPVLLLSAMIIFICAMLAPSRIYFVRVAGNYVVPAQRILEAAEQSGIFWGASRRAVRSEKVKNELLSAVPELQWVGVNTEGCVAVISVQEKSVADGSNTEKRITSIVADMDGYILAASADSGMLMVQPGETVDEGQTLISGYEDCGSYIRATQAKGEIFAQTNRYFEAVMPGAYTHRVNLIHTKKKYSLKIGKKRINLWKDSGILDGSCGRMYEEYYITLPGGFQIPIGLCIDRYYQYEMQPGQLEKVQADAALLAFGNRYLLQQMIAGEIKKEDCEVLASGNIYHLQGSYICTEMIGRERQEKIGDIHGKNS